MTIELKEGPSERDWLEVKRRALFTQNLKPVNPPDFQWKVAILKARHSPIRRLRFSFEMHCVPYWIVGHLVRHVHAQPFVSSQRNDRQDKYDRNKAPQDSPVNLIWDMNAEELMNIANKRLCRKASKETRELVQTMCALVVYDHPEFKDVLVPMCKYHGGKCYEMKPCSVGPREETGGIV
jgi:hypothetical protein